MAAYDPRLPDDAAMLPEATTHALAEALRAALARHVPAAQTGRSANAVGGAGEAREDVRAALTLAACEARELGIRPESLVRALKEIEEDLFSRDPVLRRVGADERQRFREWLVTTCIRSYFAR